MPINNKFAATPEYADLTANRYAGAQEAPSPFEMVGRLAHQLDAILTDEGPEAAILFNLFQELYSLATKFGGTTAEMFASLAARQAFAYTAEARAAQHKYEKGGE